MAALQDVQITIRELSFDRFPIPVLYIKGKTGHTLSCNASSLIIKNGTTVVTNINLTTFDTLEKLSAELLTTTFPIAYSGYFKGEDSSKFLLPQTDAPFEGETRLLSRFYFTENFVNTFIQRYFLDVLGVSVELTNLDTAVQELDIKGVDHLCLFVACMLVDYRRLGEYANLTFSKLYYSDGSGEVISTLSSQEYDSITVNIGSVFTLSDDESQPVLNSSDGWDKAGSEEFFNDRNSFWYRLYCWLRDRLEQRFQDYAFRKDSGIWGKVSLDKPLNYRTYFDSYPFTLSPTTRGIIS